MHFTKIPDNIKRERAALWRLRVRASTLQIERNIPRSEAIKIAKSELQSSRQRTASRAR